MGKSDIAFVNVAFGANYVEQQQRLKESLDVHYPNSKRLFFTDRLPEGSRKQFDSMYGFKVHAVKQAINEGYKNIIFFDPAMIVLDKLDFYFDMCEKFGVIAIQDDNKLLSSDAALKYFGYSREDIKDFHLVGGSMYVFNMDYSQKVFETWYNAEIDGIFGSQSQEASGQLQGHRQDESCMSFSLYKNGFTPTPYTGSRYNWDQNPVVIKNHFK